jgi:AcrR family transcriptional regulator
MNSTRTPRRTTRGPRLEGDSRAEILAAARTLFAARGFQGTTTRQVAELAGVDVALIHHFFGTKARLFAEVIDLPSMAQEVQARISAPAADRAEGIARLYLEQFFKSNITTFSAMMRTALGSPDAVPQLRRMLEETMLRTVAPAIGGPHAMLRAELIGAQMIGILILRHLIAVEPIASASIDELVGHLRAPLDALVGEEAKSA